MLKDNEGRWVGSPVHAWFGLTYSSYYVVPRVALEAMPLDWQERFVALMNEAEALGVETPTYHVLRDDPAYTLVTKSDPDDESSADREFYVMASDPWAEYRHPDRDLLPAALRTTT